MEGKTTPTVKRKKDENANNSPQNTKHWATRTSKHGMTI